MAGDRTSLYRRWVLSCTAGELLGFGGIPVAGGALAVWLTADLEHSVRSLVFYAVAVIGGLGEGAVLAWFQLRVLGVAFPDIDRRRWIRNTVLAAAFAWACGMLAPTLDDLVGLSAVAQVAIWVPASLLILFSIGVAQARVFRGVVERPRRWIAANVLGWLLGLPWTFVLPALLPETAPAPAWITVFVIAGILMGLTVGLVTGVSLMRFASHSSAHARYR
jgi:hypothetical protein